MNKPVWSAGYVSDAPYTLGFYREMGVENLAFCAAINGYSLPVRPGLRYCELGCGRGYGLLLQAAANPDRVFVGIDFNPGHIHEANELAAKAQISNVRFIEASFGDLAVSDDPELSDFDVVGMHGVFTWISQDVGREIQEVLRRHLKPGGFCYVSYNTMPGWAQSAPMQRLIHEIASRTPGNSLRRLSAAMATLTTMNAADTGYLKSNPSARTRLGNFGKHSPQYLVHEYLNENWQPIYVTDMVGIMGEAKLDYVGSATPIGNRVAFNVPERMMRLVNDAPDLAMRELIKDFAVNRQFRRDIYVKGGVRPGRTELERTYEGLCVIKVGEIPADREEWSIPVGTARPDRNAIAGVAEALGEGPVRIGAIRAHCEAKGIAWGDLPGIIELMMEANVLRICRSDHATVDGAPAARLNRAVFDLALGEDTHRYLASPVLGSAIASSFAERLLGRLLLEETEDAPVTPEVAHALLEQHGKRVTEKGEAVEDSGAALQKLAVMLDEVRRDALPRWRRLGIAAA